MIQQCPKCNVAMFPNKPCGACKRLLMLEDEIRINPPRTYLRSQFIDEHLECKEAAKMVAYEWSPHFIKKTIKYPIAQARLLKKEWYTLLAKYNKLY